MTLIEGVGDEVTDFFIVVAILSVGYLAWCSTRITDHLLIRTVLILQLRASTGLAGLRGNNQNANSTIQPLTSDTTEDQPTEQASLNTNHEPAAPCTDLPSRGDEIVSEENRIAEGNATEEVLIEAMDSFNNENTSLLQREPKINSTETDSSHQTHVDEQEDPPTNNASDISIKLKFINDDQKVVTGGLKELLGDFKRRHFQIELQAQKLVRLVFNGRILQPDSETLEKCGLYNNCVVHCLVHQPRPNPTPAQSAPVEDTYYFRPQWVPEIPNERIVRTVPNSTDEWDLSRLLVSILSFLLGLAWYSRYYYSQLFTATTTYALYVLTAIFTLSLFSNFFPDQDNIRNIE